MSPSFIDNKLAFLLILFFVVIIIAVTIGTFYLVRYLFPNNIPLVLAIVAACVGVYFYLREW